MHNVIELCSKQWTNEIHFRTVDKYDLHLGMPESYSTQKFISLSDNVDYINPSYI